MPREKSGYTGGLLEAEMLGEIIDAEKLASREEIMERQLGWLSEKQLRENVKEFQPGDQSDPEPRFAADLFAVIAEDICPDDYERLRFFTAVTDSPDIRRKARLDLYKGVDGFFEYHEKDGTYAVVTIDVSFQRKPRFKTDIMIEVPPDGIDPKEDGPLWDRILLQTS